MNARNLAKIESYMTTGMMRQITAEPRNMKIDNARTNERPKSLIA
jgi:hypothetical protein